LAKCSAYCRSGASSLQFRNEYLVILVGLHRTPLELGADIFMDLARKGAYTGGKKSQINPTNLTHPTPTQVPQGIVLVDLASGAPSAPSYMAISSGGLPQRHTSLS
jgi:hypothetical protein